MSRMNAAERKTWEETVDQAEHDGRAGGVVNWKTILAAHREIVSLRKVMEAAEKYIEVHYADLGDPHDGKRVLWAKRQMQAHEDLRAALTAAKGE